MLLVTVSSFAASWSAIDIGLPSTSFGIRTIAIDPASPSTFYALTRTGVIFKSTDSGGSWQRSKGILVIQHHDEFFVRQEGSTPEWLDAKQRKKFADV